MNDGVLGVDLPPGVDLVGYGDDLVVLVANREQDALADKASAKVCNDMD